MTLTAILPKAIAFAEAQSHHILRDGLPLNNDQIMLALRVGVSHPEQIRILEVGAIPLPDDPKLNHAAQNFGLLSSKMAGITLGYGIYIRRDHMSDRILSHEFRHVHQYEQHGSVAEFMKAYLDQINSVGYKSAPLEIDARNHETET